MSEIVKSVALQLLSETEAELDHLHNYLLHDEAQLSWVSVDEASNLVRRLRKVIHEPGGQQPYA